MVTRSTYGTASDASERESAVEASAQQKTIWRRVGCASAAVMLCSAFALANGTQEQSAGASSLLDREQTLAGEDAPRGVPVPSIELTTNLSFSMTSTYIERDGALGTDYPWMDGALCEPHRATTFYNSATEGGSSGTWEVTSATTNEVAATATGNSFLHTFDGVGDFWVKMTIGESTATGKLYVRYVRREMRSLLEEDRVAWLQAWKTVVNTDDATGIDLYGSTYQSMSRLVTTHNNLAGDKACDHLHDGMGFLTSHVQITRLLESSLQLIDPSVSMPYWEYTIDVEAIVSDYDGNFREWSNLDVFSDKYLGWTNHSSANIDTGAFAGLTMLSNDWTTVTNSYGLIRSPWNNLNNIKPTRYFGGGGNDTTRTWSPIVVTKDEMSTCANLAAVLNYSTSVNSFNGAIAGNAHGPIHMYTGGQSNTPGLIKYLEEHTNLTAEHTYNEQYWGDAVTFFFSSIKSLYRYDVYNCPESCSADTPLDECKCTCDPEEIMNSSARSVVDNAIHLNGNETVMRLLEYMCSNNVVMGDHASSSSPNDPSFWPMHPAVERYAQLMRLQHRFEDQSWDNNRAVFNSNIHPYTDRCWGHYSGDVLPFGFVDGYNFTNEEYYDYLDPLKSNLTYVYDNFEWQHCSDIGVHIKLHCEDCLAVTGVRQ